MEITYGDVEEGMVVICKKKQMMVKEVQRKAAIGKDPTKEKVKLIGDDAATGKPIKMAFRRAETKITVVSGYEPDSDASGGEDAPAAAPAAEKNETRSAADFDMSSGAAGAAETIPIRAGDVKKGTPVMLKDHPCKCIEVTTSKTGKHGHAKAKIVGLDVFTGSKYLEVCPTSHNMMQPVLTRSEWELTDISSSNQLVLMNLAGEQKEDLDLPCDNSNVLTELSLSIKEKFDTCPASKGVFLVILKALKTEQVVDVMVKEAA